MARRSLALPRGAAGIALVVVIAIAGSACDSAGRSTAPGPTQAACDPSIPTYPVKPRRSEGPQGTVYDQKLAPIVPAHLATADLCRYHDGELARTVSLSTVDFPELPPLFDDLAADRPRTCPEPKPGAADDVVVLVAADGAMTRVFVEHGGCRSVHLEGQVRRTSNELLTWLDGRLGGEADSPSP